MELNNLSYRARSDYDLVLKATEQGDQAAYAELMGRYKDSIYYLFFKMVNNKDDAEDLMIDSFGKAFRNLHLYQPTYAW